MKKLFAIATICLITTAAIAQQGQGGAGREQMMAAQKQRLVDSLGVTPAIADSVMALQMSYRMRGGMQRGGDNQTPPTDEQKAQMKAAQDEMNTKLKTFLTEEQITKYKAMQMRGGMGGRRGGGGNPPQQPPMQN